jgi:hypothetical protein
MFGVFLSFPSFGKFPAARKVKREKERKRREGANNLEVVLASEHAFHLEGWKGFYYLRHHEEERRTRRVVTSAPFCHG